MPRCSRLTLKNTKFSILDGKFSLLLAEGINNRAEKKYTFYVKLGHIQTLERQS